MRLSPGKTYQRVPKSKAANARYRLELLSAPAKLRPELRAVCGEDLLFYVNVFCTTYDPRKPQTSMPFITWPFQDKAFVEILRCIENGEDLVIEKSRDMGASWMCLTVMEWLWHYHRGMSFLMISRKEDLVDSPGDPDSLFWKIDFIHKHLPAWLMPAFKRTRMHFENVDMMSSIDGESTTKAAGVGGRRTAIFIDEFSRIEKGQELLAGTADATNCRIFNFTPYGTSNAAYGLATRTDIRKLRLHWSDHPEKGRGLYRYDEQKKQVDALDETYVHDPDFKFVTDGRLRSPWYDGECIRRANDREVAQMLDIDYVGSAHVFFDKPTVLALQRTYCVAPCWEGNVACDEDTGRPREHNALIRAAGGPIRLWLQLDAACKPPAGLYAAGADLSTGQGASNSCFTIVNCRTGEKVLEYATPHLRPEEFAVRCVALCWLFKSEDGRLPLFAWELQGPGVQFGKRVMELGYSNPYCRHNGTSMMRSERGKPGWVPTRDTKPSLLGDYRQALASNQFVNRSREALEECLHWVTGKNGELEFSGPDDGDPTGARQNHGDRVIADALACKMGRMLGLGAQKKQEGKGDPDNPPPGSLAWRRKLPRLHVKKPEMAW